MGGGPLGGGGRFEGGAIVWIVVVVVDDDMEIREAFYTVFGIFVILSVVGYDAGGSLPRDPTS